MHTWVGKHAEPKMDDEEDEEGGKEISEYARFKGSIRDFTKQYKCPYAASTYRWTSPYKTMRGQGGKFPDQAGYEPQ